MIRIADSEGVHVTGFELAEVKFTFESAVDVDVAGTKIKAREGEVMNLPRYVAAILEGEKYGQIQEQDMVVELKQAIVKENVQGEFEISTLDEHFYIRLRAYMKKLPETDYDKVESMLYSLLRKRHGKIVRLADSSKLTAELSSKMTVEEREFYVKLHEISSGFTGRIMGGEK
ncbi:hypothetical protein CENSYa_1724 [Cenarchaeum symbiosum A]|uniref:GINS subunit domain-containing protein n=1 Tax=Cenarchaeum symbiosum (strain A) TaxID=414004 RepID=A0RYB9_CENSY|nr:hypothetical protein CENSYa_1724 [Cenarchaeum symbiosum A]